MTHRHKRKNSRAKGARGERAAADYLSSIGFRAERNARNGISTDDLIVRDLSGVHLEVKFGVGGMDLGTSLLHRAYEQAASAIGPCDYEVGSGAAIDTRRPAVLWKPMRKCWRLTWAEPCGLVTTTGDDAIRTKLLQLNAEQAGE